MRSLKENQLGLLYLAHLLISADGEVDASEYAALNKIIQKDKIPDAVFKEFANEVQTKSEREIYKTGIELINSSTDEEKLNTFVQLYKMSEVDGRVHVKEVRLLLYSIKLAGVEFNDVVERANAQTKN